MGDDANPPVERLLLKLELDRPEDAPEPALAVTLALSDHSVDRVVDLHQLLVHLAHVSREDCLELARGRKLGHVVVDLLEAHQLVRVAA